jgi:hypothetical protein
MDKLTIRLTVGIVAIAGVACGSSSGTHDAAAVATHVGTVVDEEQIVLSGQEQAVTLAPQQARTEIEFSANSTPARTPVTLRVESGVPSRHGLVPASDAILHVATQGLQFFPPARMRQVLPSALLGRTVVAISSPSSGDTWTTGPVARLSQFLGTVDSGASAQASSVWEIEVTGSGLWAFALADAVVTQDAGPVDVAPLTDTSSTSVADGGADAPAQPDTVQTVALDAAVALEVAVVVDSSVQADRSADAATVIETGVSVGPEVRQPDMPVIEPPIGVDAGAPVTVDVASTGVPADESAMIGTWTMVSSVCNGTPKSIGSGPTLTVLGDTGYFTSKIGDTCVQTVPTTNSYPALGRMDWSTLAWSCTGTSCPTSVCSPDAASASIQHSAAVTISGSTLTITEELTPPEEYGCPSGYQVTTLTR